MAIGDGTIKQNVNVQQVQAIQTGTTSSAAVESTKNVVVPVAVDEELLKLLGLTRKQYLQLSDEQKSEVNNQINQIKNSADETNFGIKGLSVEKTTTEAASDKPVSIENPAAAKAEAQEQQYTLKREDTQMPKITEADWKKMSSDERALYLKNFLDETVLKDVPDDEKGEALKELIDQKIKQNRGFSDERWNNMSDERKERIRRNYMADFHMVIENGFTKEDLANLSYADKAKLEIQHGLIHKEKLLDKISEEITQNSVAFEAGGDIEYAKAKHLALTQEHEIIFSSIEKTKEMFVNSSSELDAKRNTMGAGLNAAGQKADGTYDNFYTDFRRSIEGKQLSPEEKKQAFIKYAFEEIYKVPKEKRAIAIQSMLGSLNDEAGMLTQSLVAAVGNNTELLESLNFDDLAPELKKLFIDINKDLKKNGTEHLSEDEVNGLARICERLADKQGGECVSIASENRNILAGYGHLGAIEIYSHTNNEELQSTHAEAVKCVRDPKKRIIAATTITNLKDDNIRRKQAASVMNGSPAEEQIAMQKAMSESSHGDKHILCGFNDALNDGIIEKDVQVPFAQNTMEATQYLPDEDAKEVQKGLVDANASGVDAENQADVYKIVMSSKFDEVQEYAASNIYRLDESVRDWARDYTKSLGKENLTEAIRTEPPQHDTKQTSDTRDASTTSETANNNNVSSDLAANTGSNTQTVPTVLFVELSEKAQTVYQAIEASDDEVISQEDAIKHFKSLSQKEQRDLLKSLPSQMFDKLPVTLCENFPEYIPTFANKGRGIEIITTCSSVIADSAIKWMRNAGGRFSKQLDEFIIDNPARFSKVSQEAALARNDNDNNTEGIKKPLKVRA